MGVDRWDWTDERVELLKKMWGEGLSCSQIAGRFGDAVTRNAVIGKVHRMGLQDRQSTTAKTVSARRAREKNRDANRKPRPWTGERSAPVSRLEFVPYRQAKEVIVVDPKNLRGIIDLEPNQCRWPIGDVDHHDFHFCDQKHIPGRSYCEAHCAVAYPDHTVVRVRNEAIKTTEYA